MNTICISTKTSAPEKVGDKTHGVPCTSKSRVDGMFPCPSTNLRASFRRSICGEKLSGTARRTVTWCLQ